MSDDVKPQLKNKKKCLECDKETFNFIDDTFTECRSCVSDEKVHRYIKGDLGIAFGKCNQFQKQKILRRILRDMVYLVTI
jgi:hypothetical protein